MTESWVTDRRPTSADSDNRGDVRLRNFHGSDYDIVHWGYVAEGAPWQHTSTWVPPEPDPPLWTEAICTNCASAFYRDGIMVPIEEVITELNSIAALRADAERFRWLLRGHGYFLEEEMLCGHGPCGEEEQAAARAVIDKAMEEE